MKAVNKFKRLLSKKYPGRIEELFGERRKRVQPPALMRESEFEVENLPQRSKSKRQGHFETAPSIKSAISNQEKSHIPTTRPSPALSEANSTSDAHQQDQKRPMEISANVDQAKGARVQTSPHRESSQSGRGQAHDPMDEEPPWLGIGTGDGKSEGSPNIEDVAESPTAAGFNIYDTAYQREVARIRDVRGEDAMVYLTRRVEAKAEYKAGENPVDSPSANGVAGHAHEGWKGVLDAARR